MGTDINSAGPGPQPRRNHLFATLAAPVLGVCPGTIPQLTAAGALVDLAFRSFARFLPQDLAFTDANPARELNLLCIGHSTPSCSFRKGPLNDLAYLSGIPALQLTSIPLREPTHQGQGVCPRRGNLESAWPTGDTRSSQAGQSSCSTTTHIQPRRASIDILGRQPITRKTTTNDRHPKHNPRLAGLPCTVY